MDPRPITILTGATSGIGHETAKKLYRLGHFLVLGNRNPEKTAVLAAELRAIDPSAHFDMIPLDLASFASIEAFANALKKRYPDCQNLINNAGVFMRRDRVTREGFEMTMGVNLLGTMYLTEILEPVLHAGAKIIMVSSVGCYWGSLTIKPDLFTHRINSFKTYFDSKLGALAYALTLKKALAKENIQVLAADPGIAYSKIFKWHSGFGRFLEKIQKRIMKSAEQASRIVVWLVEQKTFTSTSTILYKWLKPRRMPKKVLNDEKREKYVANARKYIEEKRNVGD